MIPSRALRALAASIALLIVPTFAIGATTEIRVLFDVDNDVTTGCDVGGMEGVEQVLVTQVNEGASAMDVAQTFRQECTGALLGAPTGVTGGWPAGWSFTENLLTVETRIPFSAVGEGTPSGLRVGFDATRNGFTHPALTHADGTEIMVPPPPSRRRRAVGVPGPHRVIVMDGALLDWGMIEPILTGVAGGGSPTLRIHNVFFFPDPNDAHIYFAITAKIESNDPFADDDTYFRDPGAPITVNAPGVLQNDGDPNGQPLTAMKVSEPEKGSVTLNPDGSFTYTPDNPDQNATDDFGYRATNGVKDSNVATVRIKVDQGEGPKPVDDAYSTPEDINLIVPNPGVLANDPQSPQLIAKLVTGPSHGQLLSFSADGGFTYKPNSNFFGTDSFVYTVEKENQSSIVGNAAGSSATVTITIISVNDAPKVQDQAFTLAENSPNGTVVGTVAFSDADAADDHDVSITAGNTGGAFAIDDDGVLTVANSAAVDFEIKPTFALTVRVRDDGDPARSDTATITVNLTDQNDPPIVTTGGTTSIAYTENDPATVINNTLTVTDPESAPLTGATVQISANFAAGQDVLAFTPVGAITGSFVGNTLTLSGSDSAANYQTALRSVTYQNTSENPSTAPRTITWQVNDGTSLSAPVTNTVNVISVNDAPVNAVPGAQSTNEDTDLTFSTGNGNAISISDVDGSSSVVTLVATNGTLFTASVGASILDNGTANVQLSGSNADINTSLEGLVFTPALNFNGGAQITVTTDDQGNTGTGGAQSDVDVVAITVNAVNDPPTFSLTANHTSNEDAGGQSVANFASSISVGPADEAAQTITSFNLSNDNNGLFLAQPAIAPDGTLTYTTNADLNGMATVTVTATDSGGATSSPAQTFTIVVNAVNDEPTFAILADPPASNEDAGLQTVNGLASSISAGPPNETGQTLSFALTPNGSTGTLTFASGPAIDSSGNLTYTADDDTNGTATFDVVLTDSGSNIAPNDNTSATLSFTITVNAVNDPPTFNLGGNQTVNEDAGLQTVNGFASSISVGPSDENTQTITSFNVTNDNNGLFSGQPAIDTSGNLTYTPAGDAFGSATVSVTATDSGGATSSPAQTFTITVNAVNDNPVVTAGGTLNYTENQAATAIDTGILITDVDSGMLTGATVQITANYVEGEDILSFVDAAPITGSFDGPSGTLTLTGTDTLANYQTALRAVMYNNTSDDPSTLARTVTWQVNDGAGVNNLSLTVTSTVNVAAVNDAPIVDAVATFGYTEGDGAVAIDPALNLSDPDDTQMSGATITISANYAAGEDVLSFTPVGAITGVFAAGVLTLSNTDSVANYQTALRSVTYDNSSSSPSVMPRTITWSVSDMAPLAGTDTTTINITAVNSAPVLGTSQVTPTIYTENAAPVVVDATITVADADTPNLASATVTLTTNYDNGADSLQFVDAPPITGVWNAGTGTLTLSGADTPANYQTALRSVTFETTGDDPSGAIRTVEWQVDDGEPVDNLSNVLQTAVDVAPVNDPPTVNATGPLNYTEDDGAVVIDNSVAVADLDDLNLTGASVQISGNFQSGQDVLGFTNTPQITGNFVGDTLTLSGTTSVANYQAALRTVTYQNTSQNPSTLQRTITWTVNDDEPSSGTDTTNIDVSAVNDAPVLSVTGTLNYTENGAAAALLSSANITDADDTNIESATIVISGNYVDGQDVLSYADVAPITGAWAPLTGTLTLSGSDSLGDYITALQSVMYSNTSDAPSELQRTITWTVNDGDANSTTSPTSVVNVTAVNDPPVITHPASITVNEDAIFSFTGGDAVSVADPDSGASNIQFTVGPGGTFPDGTVCVGAPVSNCFTGTFTMTLPLADINTALAAMTFQPAANVTAADTIPFQVNDQGNTGTGGAQLDNETTNVTITPINDAPALSVTGTLNYTENGAAANLLTSANITDVDDLNIESATIQITGNYQTGADVLSYVDVLPITGAWAPLTGTLTLTGSDSLGDYITALQSVQYANTSESPSGLQRTVTWTVNDGAANSTTSPTSVVNVTPVNDPPVVVANDLAYAEDDGAVPIDGVLTLTDVDDPNTITGATVQISANFQSGEDVLAFVNTPQITGSFVGDTLTLSGTTTVANYQAALRSVTYENTSQTPSTAPRSITWTVSDDEPSSGSDTSTITVTSTNDAPVLSVTGSLNPYTEGDAATALGITVTITDVDDTNMESATVVISGNYQNGFDVLAFTNQNGISGTWTAGTGTLDLLGPSSKANYVTALQSITFENTSQNPSTLQRTITFTVNDGDDPSASDTSTVDVVAVNDPPINSLPTNAQSVNEDTALFFTGAGNVISVTDADVTAGNLSMRIRATNGTTTVVTLSGTTVTSGTNGTADYTVTGTEAQVNAALGTLRFDPTLNFPGAAASGIATIQLTPNDNGNTPAPAQQDDDTFNITVNQVNDPPVDAPGGDAAETVGNVQLFYDVTPGVGEFGTTKTTGSTNGVLDDDSDPVEGSAVSVAGIVGCVDPAPFDCATVNGGQITMQTNGRFTFRPKDDSVAADSFQYILTDGTPADNVNVTVNLTFVGNPIFFVKNDAAAGGLGRSHDPFDTLAEAQTAANTAGDRVFVYFGDGATTGQNAGFTFQAANQLLQGEAIALTTGTTVNGVNDATLVGAGSQPLIEHTAGNGVTIGTHLGTTIRGLSIAGSANAINLTTAVAATGTTTISNNTIRGAGSNGVDVNINAPASGTATLVFTNNSWNLAGTHTGNGFDVDVNSAALRLNFSNNSVTSAADAVVIDGTGGGTTTITGFADNSISGNTGSDGVLVNTATFDATPGGGFDMVDGNIMAVGASGNPVGAGGMVLTSVSGNLFFDDLDIFTAAGTALGITGTGGMTFAVTDGVSTIDADNGAAVSISNTTLDLEVADLDCDTSVGGVSLSGVLGTFSAPAGSFITKASGAGTAFSVSTSPGLTTNYAGSLNVTSGAGVSLSNGGTVSFTGAMTLSTGANTAFAASSGGTVTATAATSTIKTTSGTALSVNGTTIGAAGLTFQCISAGRGDVGGTGCTQGAASGTPANGIFLNSTGSTGVLTVNGGVSTSVGGDGSGGTIFNATGATGTTSGVGVYVNGGRAVLRRMRIDDAANYGIYGAGTMTFTLEYSTVDSTAAGTIGDSAVADDEEGSIAFEEWAGSGAITSCVVGDGFSNNLRVLNTNGADLNRLTISTSTFNNNGSAGNNNLHFESRNSGTTLNFTLQTSTIKGALADWLNASNNSSSTMDAIVSGNAFSNLGGNVHATAAAGGNRLVFGSVGTLTYDILGNDFEGSKGEAIRVRSTATVALGIAGTATGTIDDNDIGLAGTANSGSSEGSGIFMFTDGGGDSTALINNNRVRQYNNHGIRIDVGDEQVGTSNVAMTVTNNTVSNPGSLLSDFNGIHLNHGTVGATDDFTSCISITGNTVTGSGNGAIAPNNAEIRLRQRQTTTVILPGYLGNNDDTAAVLTFLAANNTTSGTGSLAASVQNATTTTRGFESGAACATP